VHLTTVLHLTKSKDDGKYYITSQNDLYQVDQFVRFFAPGGWVLVWAWWAWASFFSVMGTIILGPVSYVEERFGYGENRGMEWRRKKVGWEGVDGLSKEQMLRRSELKGRIFG
jgi:hypothetical protein